MHVCILITPAPPTPPHLPYPASPTPFLSHPAQALAIIESNAVWRVDFAHLEKEPLNVLLNVPAGLQGEPLVEVGGWVRVVVSCTNDTILWLLIHSGTLLSSRWHLQLCAVPRQSASASPAHPLQAMSGPAETDASMFNQRRKPPVTPNRQMINNPGNIWVGGAGGGV